MKTFVKFAEFRELQQDVYDCATRKDILMMEQNFTNLKKDYNGFVKMDEFMKRLNVVYNELDGLIKDRPTFK